MVLERFNTWTILLGLFKSLIICDFLYSILELIQEEIRNFLYVEFSILFFFQDENRYSAGRGAHKNLKRAEKARILAGKIPCEHLIVF